MLLLGLKDVLVDFPFAQPCHRSAALAAILSMACRFAIAGCVPLFAVRATAAGSGKGLLVDVLSLIGTGRPAPRWPETVEPEEERKRILTIALAGYPAIHLDNVSKPLGSPSLDDALTSRTFPDRLLGTNTPVEAPLDLVWFASGNNMQFRTDTSRRVVPIDLDPKMERPEERTTFKHNPLLTYVSKHRPALAVAAVTVLRAFFQAQCPTQKTLLQMGSFEAWSDLIRQALVWAGEPDPNEGRKEIDAESDPAHEHLAILLECWAACYVKKDEKEQEEGITLGKVKEDIFIGASIGDGPDNQWDDLRNALGAYDPKYDQKSLNLTVIGAALRERKGSVIDHKRLVKAGLHRRAVKWRLQAV